MPLIPTSQSAGRLAMPIINTLESHSKTMHNPSGYHNQSISNHQIFSNYTPQTSHLPQNHKSFKQTSNSLNSARGYTANGESPTTQTMYTNPANLQQTIWLQQQLFQQNLQERKNQNPNIIQKPGVQCFQKGQSCGFPASGNYKTLESCHVTCQHNSSALCRSEPTTPVGSQMQSRMEWKVCSKIYIP